jgi:exosortase/archaeosortase family protein
MFVAQKCSGLTSLSVLLALAYLIACHTPVRLGWKTLMVAVMVPLALLANTVRLTLVLLAGTHISAAAAQWVHDHEAPVLIFFCSLGIMAFRQALLAWQAPREEVWMQPEGPLKAAASLESSGETGGSLLEAGDGTVDSVSVFIP